MYPYQQMRGEVVIIFNLGNNNQSLDMLLSSDFVLDVREEAVNAVFCVSTDTE